MTLHRRHILAFAMAAALMAGAPASADISSALDACLDHDLDIPARSDALVDRGWVADPDEAALASARAHALILTRMSGFDETSWATLYMQAEAMAKAGSSRSEGRIFLTQDTDTLTLEKNATGLQTCLYVGQEQDLSALQTVLDNKAISKAGVIRRIRGEAFRALVTAHSLDPDTAQTGFPEPLAYTTTFSVVLDRTEGS